MINSLLAVQHGWNMMKLPSRALVALLVLLGAGCDRFGPEDEGLKRLDATPLQVTVTQTAKQGNGELVTRQLGQFEAPWQTSFDLEQAAQTSVSFETSLEVDVRGANPSDRIPIFLILRSTETNQQGPRLHMKVFYPGSGTTVKHFEGAFAGTAYAFFADDIGTRADQPLQLELQESESSSTSLTVDPAEHTLTPHPALHFDLGDLQEQNPDAGQTVIWVKNPLFSESTDDKIPFQPLILVYHRSRQLALQPDFSPELGEKGTSRIRFLEPLSPDFACYIFMVDQ